MQGTPTRELVQHGRLVRRDAADRFALAPTLLDSFGSDEGAAWGMAGSGARAGLWQWSPSRLPACGSPAGRRPEVAAVEADAAGPAARAHASAARHTVPPIDGCEGDALA